MLKLVGVSEGMLTRIVGLSRTPGSSRRGAVTIQVAILMTALIGMAGLGIEVPSLMYRQRQLQTAADSAALGAAAALSKGYPAAICTEAYGIAAALGYTVTNSIPNCNGANGTNNITLAVNNPPTSGNYTSDSSAVEVIVSKPQTAGISSLFGVSMYNLSARAVAQVSSSYCVLTLDPNGWSQWGGVAAGLEIKGGGPGLNMKGCGIAVDATGSDALYVDAGANLSNPEVTSIVGQIDCPWAQGNCPNNISPSGSGTVTLGTLKQNQPAVPDPYREVQLPSPTPGTCSISPYVYSSGSDNGCDCKNFSTNSTDRKSVV